MDGSGNIYAASLGARVYERPPAALLSIALGRWVVDSFIPLALQWTGAATSMSPMAATTR